VPKRIFTRAYASVRVAGESLDPFDVTLALKLPYDHIHRNGEPRLKRRRDGRVCEYSPYSQGMWSMSSEHWVESPVLDTHLCWLLDQLEPRRIQIREFLDAGVKIDFFCYSAGNNPDPPSLPRETRNRAAALGIKIDIDHYQCDPDDPRTD